MRRALLLLPLLCLPACATVLKGTTQEVAVTSEPTGATCSIEKMGAVMATIPATPGRVMLPRSSNEIVVICVKQGFDKGSSVARPNFNGATFGNLLLGGIVGIVVDASSGANNSYPEAVNVVLAPIAVPVPTAPPPFVPGAPIRLQPSQPAS